MKTIKIIGICLLGFVLTIGAAIFQRMTGPTHPFKEKATINQKEYAFKFPRSMETGGNSTITLPISDKDITGKVISRIYPSASEFKTDTLQQTTDGLEATLDEQKAAGKIEYRVILTSATGNIVYESPYLTARYKDPVPMGLLVSHIICMFAAMLLAVIAGLMAVFNFGNYPRLLLLGGILLFIGGMILGAIVQKYAFGEFWKGVPFGWDLTDNKTLLTVIVFAFAIFKNYKKPSRMWTIIAVLVLLIVYSIPHSLFGSELDPKTGEVIQASILPFFFLSKKSKTFKSNID